MWGRSKPWASMILRCRAVRGCGHRPPLRRVQDDGPGTEFTTSSRSWVAISLVAGIWWSRLEFRRPRGSRSLVARRAPGWPGRRPGPREADPALFAMTQMMANGDESRQAHPGQGGFDAFVISASVSPSWCGPKATSSVRSGRKLVIRVLEHKRLAADVGKVAWSWAGENFDASGCGFSRATGR